MADLVAEEPLVEILGLLRDNWDNTNTTYSSDPNEFTTGWWNWDRDPPVVTVTNPETPVARGGGGETGYDYMTGDGRVGQRRNGTCVVNCWAGTFETTALEGEDGGSFLSPKILAWEMATEVRRILLNNAEGTTDASNNPLLTYVSPGEQRRIVDAHNEGQHPALFRYEVRARFGYIEES